MLNYQRLSPFLRVGFSSDVDVCWPWLKWIWIRRIPAPLGASCPWRTRRDGFFLSGDGWFIGWSETPVWWLRMAAFPGGPTARKIFGIPLKGYPGLVLHHSVLVLKILRSRKTRAGKRVQLWVSRSLESFLWAANVTTGWGIVSTWVNQRYGWQFWGLVGL